MSVCLVDMRGEVVGGQRGKRHKIRGERGFAGGGYRFVREKKIAGAAGSKFEYGIGGGEGERTVVCILLILVSQKIK